MGIGSMLRRKPLLIGLLLGASAAYAQTTTVYVNATLQDTSILSGSFTFNATTGALTTANFTLTGVDNATFNVGALAYGQFGNSVPYVGVSATPSGSTTGYPYINLLIPGITSLVGYTGGSFCTLQNLCDGETSGYAIDNADRVNAAHQLSTGSASSSPSSPTPTPAPTPIPPTVVLTLGGLAAVGFDQLRRRKRGTFSS